MHIISTHTHTRTHTVSVKSAKSLAFSLSFYIYTNNIITHPHTHTHTLEASKAEPLKIPLTLYKYTNSINTHHTQTHTHTDRRRQKCRAFRLHGFSALLRSGTHIKLEPQDVSLHPLHQSENFCLTHRIP